MMKIFLFLVFIFTQHVGCALASEDIWVIAHRGASGTAPESSRYAYEQALALPVDYLEGDIQRTQDGVLVIFHDALLGSDTNIEHVFPQRREENIETFTWAELQQLKSGKWFNIVNKDLAKPEFEEATVLSLEDLLKTLSPKKGPGLYLETKRSFIHQGIENQLVDLLRKYGWLEPTLPNAKPRVVFQSFEKQSLARLQELAPHIPRVLLVSPSLINILGAEGIVKEAQEVDAYGVGPAGHLCWPWNIKTWHNANLVVHAYTLNHPWQFRIMAMAGVDGMFTDHPKRLLEYVKSDINKTQ